MKWMIIIGLLCAGCASGRSYDREHRPPPRPVHGWTTNGGTWQDLGGGIVVVQPGPYSESRDRQTLIMQ